MRARSKLLIFLLWFYSFACSAQGPEYWHAVRSDSLTFCSYLILSLNANQGEIDPAYADRYKHKLTELQVRLAAESDPQIDDSLKQISSSLTELQHHIRDDPAQFPTWLNRILAAQARLDSFAANRYDGVAPVDQNKLLIDELDLDLGRLLLIYQARMFGALNVSAVDNDSDPINHLDGRILSKFDQYAALAPDHSADLEKITRNYWFVRPRLLSQERNAIPSGVAFYIERVRSGLSGLEK